MSGERTLVVDASVFITLTEIGALEALYHTSGKLAVPVQVKNEIQSKPAAERLSAAIETERIRVHEVVTSYLVEAGNHLEEDLELRDSEDRRHEKLEGDVGILALALAARKGDVLGVPENEPIVVTDDKPLRQTCKALSIPLSGSIGVLIRAVERGDLGPEEAKAKLEAMDEVGARLSASLYRKAERMIDEAAED